MRAHQHAAAFLVAGVALTAFAAAERAVPADSVCTEDPSAARQLELQVPRPAASLCASIVWSHFCLALHIDASASST
jgi:hypothetical protein